MTLLLQKLAYELPASRLVVLQKSRLKAFFLSRARDVDLFSRGIRAGNIHGRRERQRDRDKILHLSRSPGS